MGFSHAFKSSLFTVDYDQGDTFFPITRIAGRLSYIGLLAVSPAGVSPFGSAVPILCKLVVPMNQN